MRYCETARRFQGKPDRKRLTTISSATQAAAQRRAHHVRCHQFVLRNSFVAAPQACSAQNLLPGNNLQQSQTQAARYKARYALSASQPATAPAGKGMNNSQ